MNKQILLTLIAATCLGTAGLAQAKDSHRGHYGQTRGYSNHHYRGYQGSRQRNYPRSYRHNGGGHHGNHNPWGYVAGAIVLGSIIHGVTRSNRREVTTYRTTRSTPAQDYWYRVDAEGQCVDVRLNSEGDEVWTYVDASYCQ